MDDTRCSICGWPLAKSIEEGCTRENCSVRPWPKRYYDPERAKKEYGDSLPPEMEPYVPPPPCPSCAALTAERDALREENRELLYEVNESRRASMAPPADVVWCDENGKEYRLVWDSGDESVGIHGGWVCEELDGLVERLALADKLAEDINGAIRKELPYYMTLDEKNALRIAAVCKILSAYRKG